MCRSAQKRSFWHAEGETFVQDDNPFLQVQREYIKGWLTKTRDAQTFDENKQAAQRGGQIAHNARKELEQEVGKSVLSSENYLHLNVKKRLPKRE